MKKFMLISMAIVAGCVASDVVPAKDARWVVRNCPVVRVTDEDEIARIVRDGVYFDDKGVHIIGNCWRDAIAVGRWCKAQGISCHQAYSKNHSWLVVGGGRIEYQDGIGLVRK